MINDGRVAGPDPLRGDMPRLASATALADAGVRGEPMPAAEQWAARLRTAYADHVVDGTRLLARPRGAVGYVREVTGEALARWADAQVAPWQRDGMTGADWDRAADLLRQWVIDRDRAMVAATPADARRARELVAARARADRRAELERQQASADAELAAIDRGEPLPTDATPKPGGWLRRRPPPP